MSGIELEAVKGTGRRLKTEHLTAQVAASSLPYCRVAVIVGKHGHTIVERNRLRRRLRELVRLEVLPRCKNVDMALRVLPTGYEIGVRLLMAEVKQIVGRLEPAPK